MFGKRGRGMARIRVKIEHEYRNWKSPYIEKSSFGLYGFGLPLLGFRVNKQYLVLEFIGLRFRLIWSSIKVKAMRYVVEFQRSGGETDYYRVVDKIQNRLVEKDLDIVAANRMRDRLNGLCETIANNG